MRILPAVLILAMLALTNMSPGTRAEVRGGPLEGSFRIDSNTCGIGQTNPDCSLYLEFRGLAARKMYESMKSEGVADLCTSGQVKTDPTGLRCFKLAAGEHVCDVGYNFARETLVSGDMTC
jgi:hypothetical protein